MATTINNSPLSQTTPPTSTPTTPTPPAEITITESFNHSKEELRKKIEHVNNSSSAAAAADIKNLSSSTTTATEKNLRHMDGLIIQCLQNIENVL